MSRIGEYLYEVQEGREVPFTSRIDTEELERSVASLKGVADRITDAVIFGFQVGQEVRTNGPNHWQQGHYGKVVRPGKFRSDVEFPSGIERWHNSQLQAVR